MADLPALGDYKVPNIHLTGINVEAINDGDIPTDQQIVSEAHRRRMFKRSRQLIPNLNAADSAGAELRYHMVLTRRANAEMQGAPLHPKLLSILQNLLDGQAQLQTQLQNLQTQLQEGMTKLQTQLQEGTQFQEGSFQEVGSNSRSRKRSKRK
ncbi:transmembrane and coiled-coil domains protein 2 [Striga asiatica]|uniref:Transmembrane and coiled-coil domains protein 2 n=1 Tax=Striga asiatica TaxID=4170 RepID=A0A5A7RFP4_STRAF|nr:transmembrane and coiled-coil domains protein 2 [Striga asiatica]